MEQKKNKKYSKNPKCFPAPSGFDEEDRQGEECIFGDKTKKIIAVAVWMRPVWVNKDYLAGK